jgi:hypothetical protein
MDGWMLLDFKETSFNFLCGNELSGCTNVQHLFLGICDLRVLLTVIVNWRSK